MSFVASKPWSKPLKHNADNSNPSEKATTKRAPESLPDKIKKLSNVAAIACFISVMAVGFGIWGVYNSAAQSAETQAGAKNIIIAAAQLTKGQVITAEDIKIKEVPASLQVEGCLDESELDSVVGSVASSQILPGAQFTPESIAGYSGAAGLAGEIAAGMTAVSIDVDTEAGMSGLICVGDYVRVVKPTSITSIDDVATEATTIIESARVLALDSSTGTSSTTYANVTLEVEPELALQVRQAQFAGDISLILLSSTESQGQTAQSSNSTVITYEEA